MYEKISESASDEKINLEGHAVIYVYFQMVCFLPIRILADIQYNKVITLYFWSSSAFSILKSRTMLETYLLCVHGRYTSQLTKYIHFWNWMHEIAKLRQH